MNIDQNFAEGFISKCAEAGLGPDDTLDLLYKESGATSEALGRHLSGVWPSAVVSPGAGVMADSLGALAAGLTPTWTEEQQRRASESTGMNFIPGVGAYRQLKRQGLSGSWEEDEGAPGKWSRLISEQVGPMTSTLASAAAGGLLGGGLGAIGGDAPKGAGIGALLGGGLGILGNLAAGPAAALTPTRSDEDQLEYAEGGPELMNYLVPGMAHHAYWKRLGHSRDKYDEGEM